jgi:hypothetical protein
LCLPSSEGSDCMRDTYETLNVELGFDSWSLIFTDHSDEIQRTKIKGEKQNMLILDLSMKLLTFTWLAH